MALTCGRPLNQPIMSLLLFVAAFLLPILTTPASTNKGFSLELIHRDSIHSPLYPSNLTVAESLRRLVERTELHTSKLRAFILQPNVGGMRPIVSHEAWEYMVRVILGSQRTDLHLLLDMGSDITWTQTEPCHPCFAQRPPKYRPMASHTYAPLPTNHPLCGNSSRGICHYEIRYRAGVYTQGVLGVEQFTFPSRFGGFHVARGVVFGCSYSSSPNIFTTNTLGGILGMGGGPFSLVRQLPNETQNRFSYCLVTGSDRTGTSSLRFGNDIVVGSNARTIRFLQTSNPSSFYLDLLDISIDGQRLNLPPGTFAVHPDKTGGYIIDSGSPGSLLIDPVYNATKTSLITYFNRYNLQRIDGRTIYNLDLCYSKPRNFTAFPSMTFHFREADLLLGGQNLFRTVLDQHFCYVMMPHSTFSILGAYQQQNILFVYDVGRQQLTFAPQVCAGS